MAKLYAELTSDKGGRVVGKGGNEFIDIKISINGQQPETIRAEIYYPVVNRPCIRLIDEYGNQLEPENSM